MGIANSVGLLISICISNLITELLKIHSDASVCKVFHKDLINFSGLNDLERIEIERLREENVTLKQALDQVRNRFQI